MIWPAWVYCTRYSDRPSAGPRAKRTRKKEGMSSISYKKSRNREKCVCKNDCECRSAVTCTDV